MSKVYVDVDPDEKFDENEAAISCSTDPFKP